MGMIKEKVGFGQVSEKPVVGSVSTVPLCRSWVGDMSSRLLEASLYGWGSLEWHLGEKHPREVA